MEIVFCEQAEPSEPLLVGHLVRNYRSHPAILSLVSKIFYKSSLIAAASDVSSIIPIPFHIRVGMVAFLTKRKTG